MHLCHLRMWHFFHFKFTFLDLTKTVIVLLFYTWFWKMIWFSIYTTSIKAESQCILLLYTNLSIFVACVQYMHATIVFYYVSFLTIFTSMVPHLRLGCTTPFFFSFDLCMRTLYYNSPYNIAYNIILIAWEVQHDTVESGNYRQAKLSTAESDRK